VSARARTGEGCFVAQPVACTACGFLRQICAKNRGPNNRRIALLALRGTLLQFETSRGGTYSLAISDLKIVGECKALTRFWNRRLSSTGKFIVSFTIEHTPCYCLSNPTPLFEEEGDLFLAALIPD
jgi:hypothetical protein